MLYIGHDAPLKPLNTMGISGTVRCLVKWGTKDDLDSLFGDERYAAVIAGGVKTIGQGSNLLFVGRHYDGTLAQCRALNVTLVDEDDRGVRLEVAAGVALDDLVSYCCRQRWWGLENLSLIPGTVGGATVQNVGAYGVEFKDVVSQIRCYDTEARQVRNFSVDEVGYAYRDSIFKHSPAKDRYIVMSTFMKLSKIAEPRLEYGNLKGMVTGVDDIVGIRNAVIAVRRSKLPEVGVTGSAGSFFKNPVLTDGEFSRVVETAGRNGFDVSSMPDFNVDGRHKLSAAWLIDKAGWKGVTERHAVVWPGQPLVLANADGQASGRDIADLAQRITDDIYSKYGVKLETEVEYL